MKFTMNSSFFMVAGLFATCAHAVPFTFTGVDLLSNPAVSFPTTQPSANGSSLVFDPASGLSEKMMAVPLYSAGSFPGGILSVTVNLTRLGCSGANCAGGPDDFDPHILLSDGTYLIGGVMADNDGGSFLGTTLDDAGTTGTNRTLGAGFENASYPNIGDAFEINISFALDALSTTVSASFLNGSGSFTSTSKVLDPSAALSFVFMPDGDEGERYQFNYLTIPVVPVSGSVPEPTTLALVTLSIAGVGYSSRRKRGLK